MKSVLFACGLVVVGFAATFTVHYAREPPWRADLAQHRYPDTDPAFMLKGDAEICRRIDNDLLLRRFWYAREMDEIEAVIHRGYEPGDASGEQRFLTAFLAACQRYEAGAPMSRSVQLRVVKMLRAETCEAEPERRVNSAMVLIGNRLIDRPEIRGDVEALLKDPDPDVAEIVAMQLAEYDRRGRPGKG